MKKLLLPLMLLLCLQAAYSQNEGEFGSNDSSYVNYYPDGIYKTKEDFIAKKPSSSPSTLYRKRVNIHWAAKDTLNHFWFNYKEGKSTKGVKKVFAVSHNGNLYFADRAVVHPDNRGKEDRDQSPRLFGTFSRVICGNDQYLYFEAYLSSRSEALLGSYTGVPGSVVSGNLSFSKGVVWDFKNNMFDIFRNCKDYNAFIENQDGSLMFDCEGYSVYQQKEMTRRMKGLLVN